MRLPIHFRTALENFRATLRVAVDALIDEQVELPAHSTLYQYTNKAGLEGILQSGAIWLSDIFTMNDPMEIRHGCSQALHLLNKRAENGHGAIKMLAHGFSQFKLAALPELARYFIGSFTTKGDDLGQWRAYADDGCGFALGFDAPSMICSFEAQGGALMVTMPIHYDDNALAVLHEGWISDACRLLMWGVNDRLTKAEFREFFSEISAAFSIAVLQSSLFFKHEGYRDEAEYRFMEIHHTDGLAREVRSRQRAGDKISYVTYDWRRVAVSALTTITVGPASNQEQAVQLVADYLREFDLPHVRILRSQIPYRSVR